MRAKSGDGINVLLSRYKLERDPCNYDEFMRLNKMKGKSFLKIDQVYTLPIKVYDFDGKAIGSTTKLKITKETAKKIEEYNDNLVAAKVKSGDFRKNKELWIPHGLLACPAKPILESPKESTYAIFGEKYKKVVRKDKKLEGAIYYLIAGHGGPDPGAMGKFKGKVICEDEYAYDVTLRLARKLIEHGATVYVIIRDRNDGIREEECLRCDNDEYSWFDQPISTDQKTRLYQRSDAVNELFEKHHANGVKYQRAIEIHVDSRNVKERIDLFFYHKEGGSLGLQMATAMHSVIKAKYAKHRKSGEYNGTITSRDLHMLREMKPVGVFVELGNIRNPNDLKRLVLASNRQLLADWLTEGILKDF